MHSKRQRISRAKISGKALLMIDHDQKEEKKTVA